ncbi:MAG: MFS transporter [Rhizobiales bacterium]|nr:MFS transporter [Hyphomicrobiales bacterium]
MEQTESRTPPRRGPAIPIALALSMLLASLGTSIVNIALPTLAEAFSAPFSQVQAVVVVYLAALTVSVVIAGRLGDRHGLKRMLVAGLAVFALASLLCAIAPTLPLLIAARALQGGGAAFLMTLAMALMRATASEARVGRAMGLLGTVSALGTALGPSLGGLLIPGTGWRGIFWVQVPLAVLALVMALAALPAETGRRRGPSLGLWSAMSWTLASNLLVNGVVAAVMMTTLVVGPFFLGLGLGHREHVVACGHGQPPALAIGIGHLVALAHDVLLGLEQLERVGAGGGDGEDAGLEDHRDLDDLRRLHLESGLRLGDVERGPH